MAMQPTYGLTHKQDTLAQTMNKIEKKINASSLSESSVQQRGGTAGESEILVQLPGVDDPARIKQILKTAAMLELDEVRGGPFQSREEAMASKGGVLPLDSQILKGGLPGQPPVFWILGRVPVVTG